MRRRLSLFTLVDLRGRILLWQDAEARRAPARSWTLLGGRARRGESHREALVRYGRETLDLNLPGMRLIASARSPGAVRLVRRLYIGRLQNSEEVRHLEEHGARRGFRFFSRSEAWALPMSEPDLRALARIEQLHLASEPSPEAREARDVFVARVRARAHDLGVDDLSAASMPPPPIVAPGRLSPEMAAVVSLGNRFEGHGPGLATDIDDRVGIAVAVRVCEKTGARYLGHAPFATDRFGGLSSAWSPAVLPFEAFYDRLVAWTKQLIAAFYPDGPPRHVVFISGHGGNGWLTERLERLARDLGVVSCAYELAIVIPPGLPARIDAQHASDGEHSLAAALGPGCLDRASMDEATLRWRDEGAFHRDLARHPATGGMAGFYTIGDESFDPIRSRYPHIKRGVLAFERDRAIGVDPRIGRKILRHTVRRIARTMVLLAE